MFGVHLSHIRVHKLYKTHIILYCLWIVGRLIVMVGEENNKNLEREPNIGIAQ